MKGKTQVMSSIHSAMVQDIVLLCGVGADEASRQGLSSLRLQLGAEVCHEGSSNVFQKAVQLAMFLLYLVVAFSALTMFRGNETWKLNSDAGQTKQDKPHDHAAPA